MAPGVSAECTVGGTAPERKRGGLLARVTGAARAKKEEAKREQEAQTADPIESVLEPSIETRPVEQPEQPKLVDVEHDDGMGRGQSEDDLLDIPAFLRRQAN